MVFKDFRFKLLVRIGLLVLFLTISCWGFLSKTYISVGILGSLLAIIQAAVVFYHIDKTHKDIFNFLSSIQYDDFSANFPTQRQTGVIKELHIEYNKVIQKFRSLRNSKESTLNFYKSILQQIEVGIIAINQSGDIQIINAALLRMLKANRLDNISSLAFTHSELHKAMVNILPRQRTVIKVTQDLEQISVSISGVEIIVNGSTIKLISIQNIQSELEENEMDAWQNMIRVMTHEIMNSLTPITSLAETVLQEVGEWKNAIENEIDIAVDDLIDVHQAMSTIKMRSEGLLHFVDDFRNLSQIPKPKPEIFSLKTFMDHLLVLFRRELENQSVEVRLSLEPPSINLMADQMLIEQVVINILRNALEAFVNIDYKKTIEINAFYNSDSKVEILIKDNGIGIIDDVIEKIFIPFYSTKKTGSGIGLIISKHIMRSHGGSLKISSKSSVGTLVRLIF